MSKKAVMYGTYPLRVSGPHKAFRAHEPVNRPGGQSQASDGEATA